MAAFVFGSPAGATERLHALDRGWLVVAAFALAAVPGLLLLARVQRGVQAPQAEEA